MVWCAQPRDLGMSAKHISVLPACLRPRTLPLHALPGPCHMFADAAQLACKPGPWSHGAGMLSLLHPMQ